MNPNEKTGKKNKPEQPANKMNQGRTACFGYRKVPVEEKIHLVQRHFDSIARKYDFMNTLLSLGLHHLWKRSAIRVLGLKNADKVIDVCGGTADLSILAAKAVGPSGRVLLYDFNREMIEQGRIKVTRAALAERIQYIQGNAECISLAAGQFDAAMVGFGIRNLTRMEQGLKEMHRVLKPGGRIMCLEFSRPTAALFRRLYDWYSFSIMPKIGELFTGSRQAYTYLPESIRMFPTPLQLSTTLEQIGFCNVTFRRLTNGIAVIHSGTKI